ncbi:MAG: hypothetical protein MJE77_45235 [Proteobacteria bacterium]|nr:hypothetical protein [Pseudomonadota bacterium]
MRDKHGHKCSVVPDALAGFFARRSNTIRLIVLNACYSQALAERLREQIDCIIGMDNTVTDDAAITFAETFYGGLFDDDTFQTAFDDSRDAITAEGSSERNIPQMTIKSGLSATHMLLFDPRTAE